MSRGWYAIGILLTIGTRASAQVRTLSATYSTHKQLTTAQIASRATPATVTILTFSAGGDTVAQGSGFIVRADGVIVTNWHVIATADHAQVILSNGERFDRVTLLDGDPIRDVALIRIPGYGLPTLPARPSVPAIGERIVAIGSPLGLSRTVSEGIVAATRSVNGRELVQISAPISAGSSGGAVIDGTGRVFAISTAMLDGGQSLNFAVPVRYALGLLAARPSPRSLPGAAAAPDPSGGLVASADLGLPRARHLRHSLEGTYVLRAGIMRGSQTVKATGELIIGAGAGSGWIEITRLVAGMPTGNEVTGWIDSATTGPSGDVSLYTNDGPVLGYQVDSGADTAGFVARYNVGSGSDAAIVLLIATPMRYGPEVPAGIYDGSCSVDHFKVDTRGKRVGYLSSDTMPARLLAIESMTDSGRIAHLSLRVRRQHDAVLVAEGPMEKDGFFAVRVRNTDLQLIGSFSADSVDIGILDGEGRGPETVQCAAQRYTPPTRP